MDAAFAWVHPAMPAHRFTTILLIAGAVLLVLSGSCNPDRPQPDDGGAARLRQEEDRFGPIPREVGGFAVTQGSAAGYIDDRSCRECHEELYDSYQSVGMAKSLYPPDPKDTTEKLDQPFFHAKSNRYYVMRRRDGKLFLQRYCVDEKGEKFARHEVEVAWIMGSNHHGRTYISRGKNGELYRLPLAWYAKKGWGMAPGYDHAKHQRFEQMVDQGCMFCHNAYPEVAKGTDLPHMEPVYPKKLPHGIGCQRCHGPGARHVQAALDAAGDDEAIRDRILNPADFTPQQKNDLCMSCHLQPEVFLGQMMPRNFNKPVYSYKPGDPLTEFITYLNHGSEAEQRDRFQINHHAYRLRLSKCHTKSGGQLLCVTCHDPHRRVPVAKRAAHYRNKCLQCHELGDCDEPSMGHGRDPATSDCISCHMLEARPADVVHATMTDHLIRRKKPSRDLTAPRTEQIYQPWPQELVPYFPDRVGDPDTFATYRGFGAASAMGPGAAAEWVAAFRRSGPHPVAGYVNVSRGLLEARETKLALELLQEGQKKFPNSAELSWSLGSAHLQDGDRDKGIAALQRALQPDADHPEITATLAGAYMGKGEYGEARLLFEASIRARPASWSSYRGYGYVLQQLGENELAIEAYRNAIARNPDDGYSYESLARLLHATGQRDAARTVLRTGASRLPAVELAWIAELLTTEGEPRSESARARARGASRARKFVQRYPESARGLLHLALALHISGDPRAEMRDTIRRALAAGADRACCYGLAFLDGRRLRNRQTMAMFGPQFDRAIQTEGQEPLRKVITQLVQKARQQPR